MQWLIVTQDKRAYKYLKEFVDRLNIDYMGAIRKIKLKIIKENLDKLKFELVKDKEGRGYIIRIPMSVPMYDKIFKLVQKTKFMKRRKNWQGKTTKIIMGYLKSVGVDFETVEYIGD